MDSIDDYMRHWYEVLDTNSDGDIDGDYLEMDCGGKVHDTIIEWLEEWYGNVNKSNDNSFINSSIYSICS